MVEKIIIASPAEGEVQFSREEQEEQEKRREEMAEKALAGIRWRLSDWGRKDLCSLSEHLKTMIMHGFGRKTFSEAFTEMIELCKEGTEEGRVWLNEKGGIKTKISNSPDVAEERVIEKLPWVVDHDNTQLGFLAQDIITVEDLSRAVEEAIK